MRFKVHGVILDIKISTIIMFFIFLLSSFVRKYLYLCYGAYLFVLFHELSHVCVASLFGQKINMIEFTVCGMSANITLNNKKLKNIIIILAGPISNFVLASIFISNRYIFELNMALGLINLVPLYPLDGYRITKELKINSMIVDIIIYLCILILFVIYKNFSMIIFLFYIICLRVNISIKNAYKC